MRISVWAAVLVSSFAAPAIAAEGQTGSEAGSTTTSEGHTRVIIGGGLGAGSGAKYKVNGHGGSSATKPESSQFASVFLGYLYKN